MKTLSVTSSVTTLGSVRVSLRTSATVADEVRRHQLRGGDVDADLELSVLVVALPPVQVDTGLHQYPSPDFDDEAGLLGQGDDRVGGHDAADRVRPPEQGLDADDAPVGGRHDGLVLGTQLPTCQRAAQVAVQRGPVVGQALFAHVDHPVPGASLALGLVHRGVGVLEDLLGDVVAAAREGDADTGADLDLDARQDKGLPRASSMRVARGSTCAVFSRSSHRMTNSSPARRARVSPGRRSSVRRPATATRSSSPT